MSETIPQVIARNARRIRKDAQVTTESVNIELSKLGSKLVVANIENATASPRLDTLVIFMCALGRATGRPVALSHLLSTSWQVQLNERAVMPGSDLERLFADSQPVELELSGGPVPGNAEKRLAAKLGIPVGDVMDAAVRLWGHSLTDERSRRRTTEMNNQKAGRITRELIEQVRLEIGR